jgi:hypothetical protein
VGVSLLYTDALVLNSVITNRRIHRILTYIGSSVDILYKTTFELMKIDR